jgi:hypothetical protein
LQPGTARLVKAAAGQVEFSRAVRIVETAIITPAAAARRAFSAERSSQSGLELISKKYTFRRAGCNDPIHIDVIA